METKVILQYRRARDCWVCPNCETENEIASGTCMLCGAGRVAAATVERAWSPEMERRTAPMGYRGSSSASTYSRPVFRDTERETTPVYEKPSSSGWTAVAVIALVIFAICILAYVANSY
ncbi:MAG: hypothetical protein IJF61_02955 [Clostridia bacterium]|nr:hypothetical protein [Clostridia bacterium]